MYFFVNEYLYGMNSGIEHAEFKRLNLFKSMGVGAKLVTRMYNPELHRTMINFGLEKDQIVNMFDFFQKAVDIDTKEAKIADANINKEYEIDPDPTISKIYRGDILTERMIFMGGTYGQLSTHEYFDKYQNFLRADIWDWRGFKSAVKYYDAERKPIRAEFLDIYGNTVLEASYGSENGTDDDMTMLKLVNYKGQDRLFDSVGDLFTFFLNELDKEYGAGNNTFIADRPLSTYMPVINIDSESRKYIYMPMIQTDQTYSLALGQLNGIYEEAFKPENLSRLSGVITATKAQRDDIAEHIEKKIPGVNTPVFHLPAATVDEVNGISTTKKDQIVFVGRLGNDKGITRLIETFKQVHNKSTNTHFLIYGYGPAEDDAKEYAEKLGIKDVVEFKGYQTDLHDAYNDSKLFVTTTATDVQPLAMTEAASYGLPMVAFDIAYGPREIIRDGWNGLIFKDGEVMNMGAAIGDLLKDDKRLNELSNNALETAHKFSNAEVAKSWREAIVTD
ncbi:glycosyltransferase [Lentilactobacillus sp. Marseille-Q4993]|uniref:glycosyltransferase n=1 Tax=Lentilactobacillus sp. Marseille-Q4993 TaxID=3039492 RepID=UPI0024BD2434|nr:glycosyltransferase [Lentilactobacillus sp. Marseille-Q4993]